MCNAFVSVGLPDYNGKRHYASSCIERRGEQLSSCVRIVQHWKVTWTALTCFDRGINLLHQDFGKMVQLMSRKTTVAQYAESDHLKVGPWFSR